MRIHSVVANGVDLYKQSIAVLNKFSDNIPTFFIRLILAWEFGEACIEKLHGTNWFIDLVFPFPFNLLPPEISWNIAMIFEVIGAIALALGFATRFFSISLLILTIVAIATVHWPEHWSNFNELFLGYRITDEEGDGFGNYKLPLIYIVMFLPLIFGRAGRLSLDYFIKQKLT